MEYYIIIEFNVDEVKRRTATIHHHPMPDGEVMLFETEEAVHRYAEKNIPLTDIALDKKQRCYMAVKI